MSDFVWFLNKMLEEVNWKIEQASKVNRGTILILQGKCPDCVEDRKDNDSDARCPKCRILNHKLT